MLFFFGGGLILSVILGYIGVSKIMVDGIVFFIEGGYYYIIGLIVVIFIIFLIEFILNIVSVVLFVLIFILIVEVLNI